jgi:hypothetical protein
MGPSSSALFAAAKNYVAVHGCKGPALKAAALGGRRGECGCAVEIVDYAPQVFIGSSATIRFPFPLEARPVSFEKFIG